MNDLYVSAMLTLAFLSLSAAYGVRVAARGVFHSARAEAAGESVLLGRGLVTMTYWVASPIARTLVKIGVSANAITTATVAISFASAIALATGHFGVGAAIAAVAFACDALDGLVARESGTARPSGELFDAAADRYSELLFLSGLAIHFRASAALLALVLAALVGSFMVSYGSARAAALGVPAPRGAMRRAERALYLTAGAALAPVAAHFTRSDQLGELPLITAVALVALVGNVSAVRRFVAIGRAADDKLRVRTADATSKGARAPDERKSARTCPVSEEP